jgi:hypothetical protein
MASDGELAVGAYGRQVNDHASMRFPLGDGATFSVSTDMATKSTIIDHTSLLKFLQDKWGLGDLGDKSREGRDLRF